MLECVAWRCAMKKQSCFQWWQYVSIYANIKLLHNFLYYINYCMKAIWHTINIMQLMLSTEIVLNKKHSFKKEAV